MPEKSQVYLSLCEQLLMLLKKAMSREVLQKYIIKMFIKERNNWKGESEEE